MNNTTTNEQQVAFWNGTMGDKWVRMQDDLDTIFNVVLAELLRVAEPRPGDTILDVGCGAGASTFAFADAVGPGGLVVGADVSKQLLASAQQRSRFNGHANVTFVEADAQTYAFDDEQFDLVVSRFGVMFFSDPIAAFANISRSIKPDGRLAVMSWSAIDDNNPWFSVPRDVAVDRLGPPAPVDPHAPSPFAFADIPRVESILRNAGLSAVKGERTEVMLTFDREPEKYAAVMSNIGPSARLMTEYDAGPDAASDIQRGVAERIKQFAEGELMRMPATVNVFTAKA
jgi:SAM-dependent methyltransferase